MAVEHLTLRNIALQEKTIQPQTSEVIEPLEVTETVSSSWQNLKTVGVYTGAAATIGLVLCGIETTVAPYLQQEIYLKQWQAITLVGTTLYGFSNGLIKVLPETWPTRNSS